MSALNCTHTYATLEISEKAYDEITKLLMNAGYQHVFHPSDQGTVIIDMHGIGLVTKRAKPRPCHPKCKVHSKPK